MTIFSKCLKLAILGALAAAPVACDSGDGGGAGADDDGGGNPGAGGGDGAGGGGGVTLPTDISMIDDMEDKDGSITASDGRMGAWYTYNDGTATAAQVPPAGQEGYAMSPIDPARGTSTYAASTSGQGFTTWGAGFGFDLNNDGTAKQPYDASQYKGIVFWAKTGPGGIKNIRVNVQDAQTAAEGGICDKNSTDKATRCDDHRGTSVSLTEEWKAYVLPFDQMKQLAFGRPAPTFQTDKLFAIQIQAGANVKFDIWVDDIGFYK